jgi:biotin synthase
MEIADAALAGQLPIHEDVEYLLGFDPHSVEASYVCARAREMGMRACGGHGYVYAQIGVDQTPCPENCRFCSFAAVNTDLADFDADQLEVPLERIVYLAKFFDAAGVHLVSLMATAGLDFERYLDMVRAVRANVSDRLVIMANVGDLTIEQARALKDAGATAAYHALRLGEDEITDIDSEMRRLTIDHLHEAGIALMTGVEPLWQGADSGLVAERIFDVVDFKPFCMGVCRLTPVEGLDVGGLRPAEGGFLRYVAAILRLVCGESVPIGGIGGVAWVDAGCDPRSRGYGEDDVTLRRKIAAARKGLEYEGFSVSGRLVL